MTHLSISLQNFSIFFANSQQTSSFFNLFCKTKHFKKNTKCLWQKEKTNQTIVSPKFGQNVKNKTHFCNKNIDNSKQFSKKALLQQHHKKPQKKNKNSAKFQKNCQHFKKMSAFFQLRLSFNFAFDWQVNR